jgi:drug/metabolite transporter (DMT)-like permease
VEGSRRAAYAQLVLVTALFGGTWPAGKVAVDHLPPLTVATARFVISSVLLVALVRLRTHRLPLPARRDLPLVLALGLTGIAGYQAFFLLGLARTPASDGAILVPGLIPVFTMLLAWRLHGLRPTRRAAIGFAVALVGLVIVVDPTGRIGGGRLTGDLILIGAAVCWAVYTILGPSALERFDPLVATTYASVVGTLALIVVSIPGWGSLAHAGASAWLAILYLAPLGTVLAFVLYYEGVRKLGASRTAAFTLLVPVFGVASSIVVLGEPLRAGLAVGGGMVLVGLWLVQRAPAPPASRRTSRQEPAAVPSPDCQEAHSRA